MTQLGEGIGLGLAMANDVLTKCPYAKGPEEPDVSMEPENVGRDDVRHRQANNGGTLGENLAKGGEAGWGSAGTWNRRSPPSKRIKKQPKRDCSTDPSLEVELPSHTGSGPRRAYPWKVAAHHLIPGNASLEPSSLFKKFMKKGGKAKTKSGRTFTMRTNIGYNVNGNHNGAWLPGNYAIRKAAVGFTWGALSNGTDEQQEWCMEYAFAVMRKAKGQFHDAHTEYNRNALAALNKLCAELISHLSICEKECKKHANKPVDPPYRLKTALYAMSKRLKGHVSGPLANARAPWYTSDPFKAEIARRNAS